MIQQGLVKIPSCDLLECNLRFAWQLTGSARCGHHQFRQTRRKWSQEYVKNSFGQLLLLLRERERERASTKLTLSLSLCLVGNSSLYKTTHDIHQLVALHAGCRTLVGNCPCSNAERETPWQPCFPAERHWCTALPQRRVKCSSQEGHEHLVLSDSFSQEGFSVTHLSFYLIKWVEFHKKLTG